MRHFKCINNTKSQITSRTIRRKSLNWNKYIRREIVLVSENALWPLTFIEKNLDIINFRTIESRLRKIFCFRLCSLPSICYVGNMDVKCDITKNVLEIWRVFISDKNLYIIRARGMLLSDLSIIPFRLMFLLQQLRYWFNVLGKFPLSSLATVK